MNNFIVFTCLFNSFCANVSINFCCRILKSIEVNGHMRTKLVKMQPLRYVMRNSCSTTGAKNFEKHLQEFFFSKNEGWTNNELLHRYFVFVEPLCHGSLSLTINTSRQYNWHFWSLVSTSENFKFPLREN